MTDVNQGQADIDAAVAAVGADVALLKDSGTRIEAELQRLEGQGVDTTALRSALGDLDTAVGSIGTIVPAPAPAPEPTPEPAPEPTPGA